VNEEHVRGPHAIVYKVDDRSIVVTKNRGDHRRRRLVGVATRLVDELPVARRVL